MVSKQSSASYGLKWEQKFKFNKIGELVQWNHLPGSWKAAYTAYTYITKVFWKHPTGQTGKRRAYLFASFLFCNFKEENRGLCLSTVHGGKKRQACCSQTRRVWQKVTFIPLEQFTSLDPPSGGSWLPTLPSGWFQLFLTAAEKEQAHNRYRPLPAHQVGGDDLLRAVVSAPGEMPRPPPPHGTHCWLLLPEAMAPSGAGPAQRIPASKTHNAERVTQSNKRLISKGKKKQKKKAQIK